MREIDAIMFEAARYEMVEEIRAMAADIHPRYGLAPLAEAVLRALQKVPRHDFIPPDAQGAAYRNHPLSIGHGQTISQPYIVALMTDLLSVGPGDRVLEIGCGSGYQAAVLAELGVDVFSVEIVDSLAQAAARRLQALGYTRAHVKSGDGSLGWPEHAPYDGVIVTAAAGHVPQSLLDQMKPGGHMVIPVGAAWSGQDLLLVSKDEDGQTHARNVLPVRFVPLTGAG